MNSAINTVINSEVWNNNETKNLWKMLTDDEYQCDEIKQALQDVDKDVRIDAQKQARAEYVQWIIAELEETPELREFDARDKFAVRYWNRVAELAGVSK